MSISVVVLLLLAVLIVVAVLKVMPSPQDDGLSFQTREFLFTPSERSFLGVLEQALDSGYRVFGKVRLGISSNRPRDCRTADAQRRRTRSTRSTWTL